MHVNVIRSVLLLLIAPLAVASESGRKYETARTCKSCHASPSVSGVHFMQWAKSPHAKAYRSLESDRGREIAQAAGLSAATDTFCLSCHVTTTQFTERAQWIEGVGCEACHGAGSEYAFRAIMSDYEQAVAAGLTDYRGATDEETRKNIETSCLACHGPAHRDKFPNDESFHLKPFEFDEAWKAVDHSDAVLRRDFPQYFVE